MGLRFYSIGPLVYILLNNLNYIIYLECVCVRTCHGHIYVYGERKRAGERDRGQRIFLSVDSLLPPHSS